MCEIQDTISDRVFYEAMWFREARFASLDPSKAAKTFEKLPRIFCTPVLGVGPSGSAGEPLEDETQTRLRQPRALLGLAQSNPRAERLLLCRGEPGAGLVLGARLAGSLQ